MEGNLCITFVSTPQTASTCPYYCEGAVFDYLLSFSSHFLTGILLAAPSPSLLSSSGNERIALFLCDPRASLRIRIPLRNYIGVYIELHTRLYLSLLLPLPSTLFSPRTHRRSPRTHPTASLLRPHRPPPPPHIQRTRAHTIARERIAKAGASSRGVRRISSLRGRCTKKTGEWKA